MPVFSAKLRLGATAPDPADTLAARGFTNPRPVVPFPAAVKAFFDRLPTVPHVGRQIRIADTFEALQALGLLPSDGNPGTAAQVLLTCGTDGSMLIDWANKQAPTNHGVETAGGLLVADAGEYVDTGVNLTTNLLLEQDSVAFIVAKEAPTGQSEANAQLVGRVNGADALRFQPRSNGDSMSLRLNSTTSATSGAAYSGESRGVYCASRYKVAPGDAFSHLRLTRGAEVRFDKTDNVSESYRAGEARLFSNLTNYGQGSISAWIIAAGMQAAVADAAVAVVRAHLAGFEFYS